MYFSMNNPFTLSVITEINLIKNRQLAAYQFFLIWDSQIYSNYRLFLLFFNYLHCDGQRIPFWSNCLWCSYNFFQNHIWTIYYENGNFINQASFIECFIIVAVLVQYLLSCGFRYFSVLSIPFLIFRGFKLLVNSFRSRCYLFTFLKVR